MVNDRQFMILVIPTASVVAETMIDNIIVDRSNSANKSLLL